MDRPLRIGINALYLIPGGVGGTEIYLRSLLRAMAEVDTRNEYFVFTNRETTDLSPNAANFHVAQQSVAARNRPWRIWYEQTSLVTRCRELNLDVLFNPGFTMPLFAPCRTVTVFHDLQHKRHPEYFRWFDLPFWQFFLYWSSRRAGSLIAVSDATREDLLRYYAVDPARVHVVPHGVDDEFYAVGKHRRAAELERFVLCVSTLHPHKNLERLVRAFGKLHWERPDFKLILAGMHGFQTAGIERVISECGLDGKVILTGWLPREELLDLYRHAWAFAYPSLFEGFGMPVLEALAAGIPCVVSNLEPMKSNAGNAALLVDPSSEDAIAEALLEVVQSDVVRARLAEAGPLRAAQFSWRKAAESTIRVLEDPEDRGNGRRD